MVHWVHKDPPAGQSRLQPARCTRWLFEQRQTQRFAELGVLTAVGAEIMSKDVIAIELGTELSDAWELM